MSAWMASRTGDMSPRNSRGWWWPDSSRLWFISIRHLLYFTEIRIKLFENLYYFNELKIVYLKIYTIRFLKKKFSRKLLFENVADKIYKITKAFVSSWWGILSMLSASIICSDILCNNSAIPICENLHGRWNERSKKVMETQNADMDVWHMIYRGKL